MNREITGLHHVTALASDAARTNAFYTRVLGLRRVKTTVNFDKPDVYHLCYGDTLGRAGTVMTFFPMADARPGRRGVSEVSCTAFSVPEGSLGFWRTRLRRAGFASETRACDARRLSLRGPDDEALCLVEVADDPREPYVAPGIAPDVAIRGLHGVELTLRDVAATAELLIAMGFAPQAPTGARRRFVLAGGNGAQTVDLLEAPDAPVAVQGAGSVHHVAFSVPDRAAQDRVRVAMQQAGMRVTDVLDRFYFHAIYFRSPGGVLFEVATEAPGFEADEDRSALGQALKLPDQHEHLRDWLTDRLQPLEA
ncbi:MAG: VOC family protein [Pararhodobacter sp.]